MEHTVDLYITEESTIGFQNVPISPLATLWPWQCQQATESTIIGLIRSLWVPLSTQKPATSKSAQYESSRSTSSSATNKMMVATRFGQHPPWASNCTAVLSHAPPTAATSTPGFGCQDVLHAACKRALMNRQLWRQQGWVNVASSREGNWRWPQNQHGYTREENK